MTCNPFVGLRPFQSGEEYLFFGREGHSEDILRRQREKRFLAVLGTSGSGKSSLIRAGLLPYLHSGFMKDAGSHWRVAIFRPESDPMGNLVRALQDPAVAGAPADNEEDATKARMLLDITLRRSGLGLVDTVRLAQLPEHENVLIVVDQFEELFRFANAAKAAHQQDDASTFVKLLLEATTQTEVPIYVVITMRSDFIGDCARFRGLPEAVTAGLYLIPNMTRDQRRLAIEGPVRVGAAEISPRLVNRLLNDVGEDPNQLPILQHALMRTWDYWQGTHQPERPIDVNDYLSIGGMAEALSRHADEAYNELPGEKHRELARKIFQSLTEKGPDNREIRRPTTVANIAATADAKIDEVIFVIDHFRQPGRSFLMPPINVGLDAEHVIDISHESLIGGWAALKCWVEQETRSAWEYRRLAETAERHAERKADLLREPELSVAVKWRNENNPNPAWGERYHPGFAQTMAFLKESENERDAEQNLKESLRQQELRRTKMYLAIVGTLAILLGLSASMLHHYWKKVRSENQELEARKQQLETQNEQIRDQSQRIAEKNKSLKETIETEISTETQLKSALKVARDQRTRATGIQNMALKYAIDSTIDFQNLSDQSKSSADIQSYYEGLLNGATEVHSKILEHDPDNRQAMLFKVINLASFADLHRRQGDLKKTREDCDGNEPAAEKLGRDTKNYFRRMLSAFLFAASGETRMQLDDEQKALTDVERADEVADTVWKNADPNDELSWDLLSLAYSTSGNVQKEYGKLQQAADSFRKAVQSRARASNAANEQRQMFSDLEQLAGLQIALDNQDEGLQTYGRTIEGTQSLFKESPSDAKTVSDLLRLYTERADALHHLHRDAESDADYKSARAAVATYWQAVGSDPTDQARRAASELYRELANHEYDGGRPADALKDTDQRISLLLPLTEKASSTTAAQGRTREAPTQAQLSNDNTLVAQAFGSRSWFDVLVGNFNQAIEDADRGLSYDHNQTWLLTNKAHGYLFSGKEGEARKIYLGYASEAIYPGSTQTFREGVLKDFTEFRKRPAPGMDLSLLDSIEGDLRKSATAPVNGNPSSKNSPDPRK